MTALAADKNVIEKEGKLVAHPVIASDIIFKGAMVKHNAAGYLAPCSTESGAIFAGIAYEQKDNSAGSAGDIVCRVLKKGRFRLLGSGFSQATVGDKVYASDDQTLTLTYAASLQFVGHIDEYISSTEVYVKIDVATDQNDSAEIGVAPAFAIVYAGEFTTAGGDVTESIAQVGILAADLVHVTLQAKGATPVTIIGALAVADAITVEMSADPSTDHVLTYSVMRAIA